jgi:hypothetical protein
VTVTPDDVGELVVTLDKVPCVNVVNCVAIFELPYIELDSDKYA